MELDYSAPAWVDWPYPDGIHDSEHMRKAYPNGFTFPCCEALGTEANEGCKLGKHRAADGKRSKYPGSDGETASEDEETEEEFDESEEDWDDDEDVDEDEEDDQDDQDGAGQDKVKKDGDQEE